MPGSFSETLAALRRRSGRSQRQVAAELGISQALLSHYENGTREPGLDFLCRACDYFGVSADYLLGRSAIPGQLDAVSAHEFLNALRALTARGEDELEKLEGHT